MLASASAACCSRMRMSACLARSASSEVERSIAASQLPCASCCSAARCGVAVEEPAVEVALEVALAAVEEAAWTSARTPSSRWRTSSVVSL